MSKFDSIALLCRCWTSGRPLASRQVLRPTTSKDIRRLYTWRKRMETIEFRIASPRFWATRLLPPVTFCHATTSVRACLVRIDLFFDTTGGMLQRKDVDKKESIPSPLLLQAHGVAAKMRHKNGRILLPVSLHAKNSDHFHCRKDRIQATRHLWKEIRYHYYTSYKHIQYT